MRLKRLSEQVIVLTGASSGIGLVTARLAAERGARLVLASRSEDALRQLTEEINGKGGEAIYVAADVGNQENVQKIAQAAMERFGGFDTWINNAAGSIYGKIEDTPIADMRRLFDTNVWGLIYGSLEAVRHLKRRGGALINVGSTVSERAVPLQGVYSASKHAVKGFTDALRMELEADGAPVSVTLIKPGAIDTPFTEHGKNYLEAKPQHVAPVYSPHVVAETILYCCENQVRDIFVGGGGKFNAALGHYAPRLADKYMESAVINGTKSKDAPLSRDYNGLDHGAGTLHAYGSYPGRVKESSLYTTAALHPVVTAGLVAGAGLTVAALWGAFQKNRAKYRDTEALPNDNLDDRFSDETTDLPRSLAASGGR